MTKEQLNQLGKTLWDIADQLRGAMNADDFRDYMLSFLFLRYLSDNYEQAAKKELGALATQKRWHTGLHTGGTNYLGVTKFYQHRTFRMFSVVTGNANFAELIKGATTGSHTISFSVLQTYWGGIITT